MPVPVSCPACGMTVHVPEEAAGQALRCPRPDCGTLFNAPAYFEGYHGQMPPGVVRVTRPGAGYGPPRRPSYRRRPPDRAPEPDAGVASGLGVASLVVAAVGLIFSVSPC